MTLPVRVGICPDFREEGWPSMDRVADTLLSHLEREHAGAVAASSVAPPFTRRASRVLAGRAALNIDRGMNRLWDYPRHVRRLESAYDVFHVIDHSYSQLALALPPSRTVITCHDLDTFRSVLDPAAEPRSTIFKAMTRRILTGFLRAACITCDTAAVRDELVARGLVEASRIVVAPIGVDAAFSAQPDVLADAEASRLVGAPPGSVEVLHVGSTVPRKRVDSLLRIASGVRRSMPNVHLVRVGGAFTGEQMRLASELGLDGHVSVLPTLDDRRLAAVYRRAALVLLPSAREGFGLPVVEAMTCGTPVVASDLPVLREVGGGVAEHCAVDDLGGWIERALELLHEREGQPRRWSDRRARGEASARHFTWSGFAATMAGIYTNLACHA